MTSAVAPTESPARPVGDHVAWLIAVLPLANLIATQVLQKDLFIFVIGLNVALCAWDELLLKEAGYPRLSIWIFLIPVYLWKRAALLKRSPIHFWVWLVAFALSIGLPELLAVNEVNEQACGIVTSILRQADSNAPTCKGILITEDPGTGFRKGKALLSDGSERLITIEERNDSIEVQVLPGRSR